MSDKLEFVRLLLSMLPDGWRIQSEWMQLRCDGFNWSRWSVGHHKQYYNWPMLFWRGGSSKCKTKETSSRTKRKEKLNNHMHGPDKPVWLLCSAVFLVNNIWTSNFLTINFRSGAKSCSVFDLTGTYKSVQILWANAPWTCIWENSNFTPCLLLSHRNISILSGWSWGSLPCETLVGPSIASQGLWKKLGRRLVVWFWDHNKRCTSKRARNSKDPKKWKMPLENKVYIAA